MKREVIVPLTIDILIGKLEEAKKLHGGDTPVMSYHGDGAYEVLDADDAQMEVIAASNVYPEDKQFTIKVGEDVIMSEDFFD